MYLSERECQGRPVEHSNMGSRMGLIGCLIIVVAIVLQLRGATAETVYTVGDSLGWAVPPNTSYYSTWATTNLQTFLLGDSLGKLSTSEIGDLKHLLHKHTYSFDQSSTNFFFFFSNNFLQNLKSLVLPMHVSLLHPQFFYSKFAI
jgi:hypothetical protein